MVAGATAGMVSSLVTCPLDVAKTRLQNQGAGEQVYRGAIGTLRTIFAREGLRGWYHGLTPTMLGYLPNWAIYFAAYENMKALVKGSAVSQGTSAAQCRMVARDRMPWRMVGMVGMAKAQLGMGIMCIWCE